MTVRQPPLRRKCLNLSLTRVRILIRPPNLLGLSFLSKTLHPLQHLLISVPALDRDMVVIDLVTLPIGQVLIL